MGVNQLSPGLGCDASCSSLHRFGGGCAAPSGKELLAALSSGDPSGAQRLIKSLSLAVHQ